MKTKKIISLLLAVMMIVAVIPAGIISISAEDTTYTAVEFTPDSWLCEKYPNRPTSTYPMATEDGKNFYYQAPRGDEKSSSNNEIGSSDEGLITSVKDYNFADGFKFTFDANVCRAGCKTYGNTLFTISFGTAVKLEVGIGDGNGYKLTVNGTTYTMNPWPPCTDDWAPLDEAAANLINGIYTIEYMDGKVTVELNGKAIDFGQDIRIDAEVFAAGKIQFEKGWTWTKANITNAEQLAASDYKVDFLIFSNVALSMLGEHIHTYGEYVSNNDATCTANGTKTAKCTVEGCEQTNTVIIPNSAGHSFKENGNGTKTCSVCGITSFDVTWSADNGAKAVNGNSYAVPAMKENGSPKINQNWNVAGGTTAIKYAVLNAFKVRSDNALDLSKGFKLSFDALLVSTGGGQSFWNYSGYKFLEVTIGEMVSGSYDKVKCIKFEIDAMTDSYILTVNGESTTVEMPSKGSKNTQHFTAENAPDYNKSYSIEYKNGYVVVYGNGEEIARCALADASILENARITIRTREESTADMTAYTTEYDDGIGRVTVFSNVKLETIPAPVAPVYEGVQEGSKVDDVFSVRFVATVKNLNYSEVGFKITAMDGAKSWTKSTNIVYSKLIGNTDTGIVEYTKENLSGEYIYALTIQGVPKTGTVTFNVTTYGIVDGVEVEGTTYAVTYTNGVYVNTVAA